MFCDNSAAVRFSHNSKSTSGSKHIDIKYFFVREKVQESQITMEQIATENMIADPLTKGLTPKVFQEHVTNMGLVSSFDVFY